MDALDPKAVGDKKIKFLSKNLVSIDCEMVGVGFGGDKSVLARATIVAGNGDVLLDEFCSSPEKVGIFQRNFDKTTPKIPRCGSSTNKLKSDSLIELFLIPNNRFFRRVTFSQLSLLEHRSSIFLTLFREINRHV